MKGYLELLNEVRANASLSPDRTGIGRYSLRVAPQIVYEMDEGFPLQTTKFVSFESVAKELVWFLTGDTKISTLLEHNIHIWSPDAFTKYYKSAEYEGETVKEFENRIMTEEEFKEKWDDCGPIYGYQFRRAKGTDQIKNSFKQLKENKMSKKIVVTPWNPSDLEEMALEPCHALFQPRVYNGKEGEELVLHMYQRSADVFLGVPYNIPSYSLLLHMAASYAGVKPGAFVHTFGDAHLYADHLLKADIVLSREPFSKPEIILSDTINDFTESILRNEFENNPSEALSLVPEMFKMKEYQHHKGVWAPLHVGLPHELMPDWERRKKYYEELSLRGDD